MDEEICGQNVTKMNETLAFKELVRCSKTKDLRQLGLFLYEVRCKWEHHTEHSGEEGIMMVVTASACRLVTYLSRY
jgi:hypothetical protein